MVFLADDVEMIPVVIEELSTSLAVIRRLVEFRRHPKKKISYAVSYRQLVFFMAL